jgi:competence protein ComEC
MKKSFTKIYFIKILLALALLCAGCRPAGIRDGVSVHFINVGQGDAILIQTSGGNLLIDSGDRSARADFFGYLSRQGVREFAMVIATHPHSDHIGNLAEVVRQFPVRAVMMPRAPHTTQTFEDLLDALDAKRLKITAPVPGETFALGDAELLVLGPATSPHQDLNNDSVLLKMTFGQVAFLFTGDAEAPAEAEALGLGLDMAAQVLKAGHHGSASSGSPAFLDAVNPECAVISCGAGNDYGHPHGETLQAFRERGIHLYRTDVNGNILFVTDGSSYRVETDF